jgi:hypothetical protein
LSYILGWLLRDSSLGLSYQGFKGSTGLIVGRYCVWVGERRNINQQILLNVGLRILSGGKVSATFIVSYKGLVVQESQYLFNLLNKDLIDLRRIIIFIVDFLSRKRYFQDNIAVFNPITLLVTGFLTQRTCVSRLQTRIKFDKICYLRRLLHLLHKSLESLSESE